MRTELQYPYPPPAITTGRLAGEALQPGASAHSASGTATVEKSRGKIVALSISLHFLPFFPAARDIIMKICGACERELPDASFCEEQRRLRQSSRRCEECVATGNELVLMKKGRTRSEEDDCPICSLPLSLDFDESMVQACCMKEVCNGCTLAARKRGMWDCPFCRAPRPDESQTLAMIRKRVNKGDPIAIFNLGTQYPSQFLVVPYTERPRAGS